MNIEELYKQDQEQKEQEKVEKKAKREKRLSVHDEDTVSNKEEHWKPYEIKDFTLPEFQIPVKKSNNAKASLYKQLSKVLAFVDFTKRKRAGQGCTVMPIPTTSRQNLMIWDSSMAVSRAIDLMETLGLISLFDNSYRFGVPYPGGCYCKLYAYYKDNEDKLIEYCKDNGISKFEIKNAEDFCSEQVEKLEVVNEEAVFEIADVRFGKNLDLEKPQDCSKSDFEVFLTYCLYHNYPDFRFHQIKADEINSRFYENYPDFKLRFKPNFTWKGNKVVKIGIRLTNKLCSVEKAERKELLKQFGFNLEKDVKSSVPRLTLSLNKGEWIGEDVDLYKLINDEFEPGSEFTEARRDAIKHFMLMTYFEEGSDKLLGKNVTYKLNKKDFNKSEVDEMMGRLRRAAFKALGEKFYGNDIFYVESCVYLMTLYDLLTSGHMVWIVYGAFYSNGEEDQETFEFMITNGVAMNFRYFLDKSCFNQGIKKKGVA